MRAWASSDVPPLERLGHGARRCASTTPPPGACAPRPRRRRAALRLRHHAVRRDAPRPRRDVPRLRPAQPGLARRRPRGALRAERHRRRRPAARAGRPRPAWTGASSPSGRPSCSATTWRRCGCSPPDDYVGAVESIPLVVELVQQLEHAGHAYDVDGDLYFAVRSDPRFGSVSHLDRRRDARRCSASAGGDPDRPGKKAPARLPAVARRAPGRAGLGLPAGPRPARLAHRVQRDRAAPPRRELRRPGRRQRPGLPAPRDERLARRRRRSPG